MWPYYAVLAVLTCLALYECIDERKLYGHMAAATVATFAALRYETGFDWMAYDAYFRASPGLLEYLAVGRDPHTMNMEIGYFGLNVLVRSFANDVHALFFTASIMTVVILHYVISKITTRTAIVWLVYFGLLFIAGQMTLVRQNIASCLVLLALFLSARGLIIAPPALIAASATFHVSTLPLIPLPFFVRIFPPAALAVGVVASGVIVLAVGINVFSVTLNLLSKILPASMEATAVKMSYYATVPHSTISYTYIAMALAHGGMLALLYLLSSREEREDPFVKIALWLLIGQLGVQLFFHSSTDLWARAMLITIPWAVATLTRLDWTRRRAPAVRIVATSVFAIFGAVVLTRVLLASEVSPLIPYHSILHVALGEEGNGRERAIQSWLRDYPNEEHISQALAEYKRLGVYHGE